MESINYKEKGIVFDIQRYSINDGPGIRTIVFLKGCPLRCVWCSNPESQQINTELMYRSTACIHCGRCVQTCNHQAIGPTNRNWIDRDRCVVCGECVNVCPASALVLKGKEMTVEEVVNELKKDESYYWNSNGGITLSGGEALLQKNFAKELLKASKAQGWNTAIETEGYISEDTLREVLPYSNQVLLDIKTYDTELHKKYTGVNNDLIKDNARIIQSITNTIIRVPVIPGVNDNINEFTNIVSFVKTLPNVSELHILPYHNYGENKYYLLGRDYILHGVKKSSEEHIEKLKEIVEKNGLSCHIGG